MIMKKLSRKPNPMNGIAFVSDTEKISEIISSSSFKLYEYKAHA